MLISVCNTIINTVRRDVMKHIKTFVALMLALVIMIGCAPTSTDPTPSPKDEVISSPKSDPTMTPDQSESAYAIGDKVTVGNWEITVESFDVKDQVPASYGSFKPDSGNKYVVVNLEVKNNGSSMETFWPTVSFGKDYVKAIIAYGEYTFSSSQLLGHEDDLHDTALNPLSSKKGIIAFSVAEEAAISGELQLKIIEGGKAVCVFDLK